MSHTHYTTGIVSAMVVMLVVTEVRGLVWTRTLFGDTGDVIDVDSLEWKRVHPHAAECAWMLLYYDSECGHCRSFAPRYAAAAVALRGRLVGFAALNCAVYDDACAENGVSNVPHVVLSTPRGNRSVNVTSIDERGGTEIWEALLAALGKTTDACAEVVEFAKNQKRLRLSMATNEGAFVPSDEVDVADVAGALFHTLLHEVPMAPPTAANDLAWIQFVDEAAAAWGWDGAARLPRPRPSSRAAWRAAVEAATATLPIRRDPQTGAVVWTMCRGSSAKYRGYPCAMWVLLHSLVGTSHNPPRALRVASAYIGEFFFCAECRAHFRTFRWDAPGRSAALKLWDAHNAVNERLANAASTDPFVPKRRYPSAKECPPCVGGDGELAMNAVEAFLRNRYHHPMWMAQSWIPDALTTMGLSFVVVAMGYCAGVLTAINRL